MYGIITTAGGYAFQLWRGGAPTVDQAKRKVPPGAIPKTSMELSIEPHDAAKGHNQTWHLTSLAHTELFLRDAVSALAERSESKSLSAWIPHAWFLLRDDPSDRLFHRALSNMNVKIAAIIGGRTTLDYATSYALPAGIFEFSMDLSPFEHQRSTILFLADTELLMVQLDQRTTEGIEQVFQDFPTTSEIPPESIRALRLGKASISVTLVREPEEVERHRHRFNRVHRARS